MMELRLKCFSKIVFFVGFIQIVCCVVGEIHHSEEHRFQHRMKRAHPYTRKEETVTDALININPSAAPKIIKPILQIPSQILQILPNNRKQQNESPLKRDSSIKTRNKSFVPVIQTTNNATNIKTEINAYQNEEIDKDSSSGNDDKHEINLFKLKKKQHKQQINKPEYHRIEIYDENKNNKTKKDQAKTINYSPDNNNRLGNYKSLSRNAKKNSPITNIIRTVELPYNMTTFIQNTTRDGNINNDKKDKHLNGSNINKSETNEEKANDIFTNIDQTSELSEVKIKPKENSSEDIGDFEHTSNLTSKYYNTDSDEFNITKHYEPKIYENIIDVPIDNHEDENILKPQHEHPIEVHNIINTAPKTDLTREISGEGKESAKSGKPIPKICDGPTKNTNHNQFEKPAVAHMKEPTLRQMTIVNELIDQLKNTNIQDSGFSTEQVDDTVPITVDTFNSPTSQEDLISDSNPLDLSGHVVYYPGIGIYPVKDYDNNIYSDTDYKPNLSYTEPAYEYPSYQEQIFTPENVNQIRNGHDTNMPQQEYYNFNTFGPDNFEAPVVRSFGEKRRCCNEGGMSNKEFEAVYKTCVNTELIIKGKNVEQSQKPDRIKCDKKHIKKAAVAMNNNKDAINVNGYYRNQIAPVHVMYLN